MLDFTRNPSPFEYKNGNNSCNKGRQARNRRRKNKIPCLHTIRKKRHRHIYSTGISSVKILIKTTIKIHELMRIINYCLITDTGLITSVDYELNTN